MIIETSSNQHFQVSDIPGVDHAWVGIAVKRSKGAWVAKANAKPIMVRKAATRIVEAA